MSKVLQNLQELVEEAENKIAEANTPEKIEKIRVQFLGRKGTLTDIFKSIPSLPDEEKPKVGQAANKAKNKLETLIKEAAAGVKDNNVKDRELFDPTLPGEAPASGHIHPLTHTIEEVCDIFRTMGFTTAEGPEVEKDWYNFEALNIPSNHPSRDDFDTFYVSDHVLLRSQTSTVQIRTME